MYFTVLNESRTLLARRKINGMERTDVHSSSSALPKLSNTENLIAGGASRAAIGFVMMPATVIKVRYEVTTKNGISFCNCSAMIVLKFPKPRAALCRYLKS